jgi:phenylalanyl-tRNA synthetase beta chain
MTRDLDIESPVLAGAVYFLPKFLKKPKARHSYKPFSLLPPAIRDLAVIVSQDVPAGTVEKAVREAAARRAGDQMELESVRVFDIYKGPGLPENHVSVACKLIFRHPERTLQDKEVNSIFQSIQSDLDGLNGMQVRR